MTQIERINTDKDYLYKDITDKIINCFYEVYKILGFGFLEKVYQKSLKLELELKGLKCQEQTPIKVFYKENSVGDYFADLIVEEKVIIEIKAIENLVKENESQLINYLKATNYEVGLLLNFGKKPEIKRKIYTNNLKSQ